MLPVFQDHLDSIFPFTTARYYRDLEHVLEGLSTVCEPGHMYFCDEAKRILQRKYPGKDQTQERHQRLHDLIVFMHGDD